MTHGKTFLSGTPMGYGYNVFLWKLMADPVAVEKSCSIPVSDTSGGSPHT
jgi:hypothetical protein